MSIRKRYQFSGIVQGVGFRPFIYRLATSCSLKGFVHNTTAGVIVEVEGDEQDIDSFISRVSIETPPMAEICEIESITVPPSGEKDFRILTSDSSGLVDARISPDIATCDDCLSELFDPSDRRFCYPFINCTNCGPRLTIIRGVPYDRERTSMSVFDLCEECRAEYEDPSNRRFHAEPNACPACGPRLKLLDETGKPVAVDDVIREAIHRIRGGAILAIKGLGGFHLCADATNTEAIDRLRSRKYRQEKPLAIMVKDIEGALRLADVSEEEKRLLLSPTRPIVLLRAHHDNPVSPLVAPGMNTLGIMLPYTPLHHLLMKEDFTALVMTSANQTDEPICIDNEEAVGRLEGIADTYVVHDRQILGRCDDSITMIVQAKPYLLRRSRGYSPRPILLKEKLPEVLAVGAHLKSSVCVTKGNLAYMSPHVGDLETPLARDFLMETIDRMQDIVQVRPGIVACDLHPRYYSARLASSMDDRRLVKVQHHHAHVVSCMADNRIDGRVIGLSMDGTGYGEDGRIWGGEFLVADEAVYERAGHLKYLPLLGGEAAIRQPWRIGVSLLKEAYHDQWPDVASLLGLVPPGFEYENLQRVIRTGLNTPLTSSLGRLFDGVASLLDLKRTVNFEGQAAMGLEAAAQAGTGDILPYVIVNEGDISILDLAPAVKSLVEGSLAGVDVKALARSFHATLIASFVDMAEIIRDNTGLDRVVLSGGCFQNRILVEGCAVELERSGFSVFTHQRVPANDGGIALGQAVIAGTRAAKVVNT